MSFSFDYFCKQSTLIICSALQKDEPSCYARNADVGALLFQPSTLVILAIAFIMTIIMILHIRSKYTAVGRSEIVMFFYLYLVLVVLEFFLLSNIIPAGSGSFNIFAAIHTGLVSATFWVLLLNGFVGFQWFEDGTAKSVWTFIISAVIVFGTVFGISLSFFNSKNDSIVLFIVYFIFNGAAFLIYTVLQIILVLKTLEDLWPLGDLILGLLFFAGAQVLLFYASQPVCELARHYIDGVFGGTACNLLAVMMVYKYWDSITKEDLEFCVTGGPYPWDIKENLPKKQ